MKKMDGVQQIRVIDPKLRVFKFYGSAEVPDTQRQITRKEYLQMVMPVYMSRGGPLMDSHTNKHFGRATNYQFVEIPDDDGHMVDAVEIEAMCFDNYSSDDEIWDDLQNGRVSGFSWGGDYNKRGITVDGDGNEVLPPVGIFEWSAIRGKDPVTGLPKRPAVSIARLTAVSAAKSDTAVEHAGYDYPERLQKFGDSHLSVGWKDKEGQVFRFNQLSTFLKPGKSVLDVGAGLGHFEEHLAMNGIKMDYLGIDNADEMVSAAKASGRHVAKADIMEFSKTHDYVVASGTFNTEGGPSLYDSISKMDAMSREGYGFNFLTDTHGSPGLKSHDMRKVQDALEKTGCKQYDVFDGYAKGEKMVFVSKTKERTYLRPGESAPEGANVQQGPNGGQFYESGGDKPAPKPKTPAQELNDTIDEVAPKPPSNFPGSGNPKPMTSPEEGRIFEGIQDEASSKKLIEYDSLDDKNLWDKFKETQRYTTKDNDIAAVAVFKRVHDQDADGAIRKTEESFVPPDVGQWKEGTDYEIEPLPTDVLHPNPKGAVLRDGRIIVNKDFWENATPEQRKVVLLHEAYHKHLQENLPQLGHDINEILAAGRYQLPWNEREKIAGKMGERGPSWQEQGAVGYERDPGQHEPEGPVPESDRRAAGKSDSLISADTPRVGNDLHSSQEGLGGKTMIQAEAAKSEAGKKAAPAETKPEDEKKPEEVPAKKDEPVSPPADAPAAPAAPANDPSAQMAAMAERMSKLEAQVAELMQALSAAPAEGAVASEGGMKTAVKEDMISAKKIGGLSGPVPTPRAGGSPSAAEEKVSMVDHVHSMDFRTIKERSRGAQRKVAQSM